MAPSRAESRLSPVAVAHVILGVGSLLRRTYGAVPMEPLPDGFEPFVERLLAGPLGRSEPARNRQRPVLGRAAIPPGPARRTRSPDRGVLHA